ncbi:MAG: transcriptional regulator, Crp/Fnr family [Thermoleophilia bacterium]|nr:transcriptional regulator, Crp/Fnr family [Thermoleophilia bacterium]
MNARAVLEPFEDAADRHASEGDWSAADAALAAAHRAAVELGAEAEAAAICARRAGMAGRFGRPEAADRWAEVERAARDAGDLALLACALVHRSRSEPVTCAALREAAAIGPESVGWSARAANVVAMARGEWEAAARHAEVAAELARVEHDRELAAQAAWGSALALGALGEHERALAACRRATWLMTELHAFASAEHARAASVDMLAESLLLEEADRESRRLVFTTEQYALDDLASVAVALRALTLLRLGRLDEAAAVLVAAPPVAEGDHDGRALRAVVAAHVCVEHLGPSLGAAQALDAAQAACEEAGIATYALEVDLARVTLDLASGLPDGAAALAASLTVREPMAAGRLALALARHATVERIELPDVVTRLAATVRESSSPWAGLAARELAAHVAADAAGLDACGRGWAEAGFALDAARTRFAAERVRSAGRRREVQADVLLGLLAEFGRMGARPDCEAVARALRVGGGRSAAGRHAALVGLETTLFDGVPDAARRELARACSYVTLRRGQSLAGGGGTASNEEVVLVLAGRVRLSTIAPSGKVLTVDVLDPGELWVQGGGDPRAVAPEASASEPSDLAILPRAALEALVDRHPRLGLNLARLLGDGLSRSRSLAEQLAHWSVQGRFARLLVDFDARYGEAGASGGSRIAKRFAQGELAELIGTRRETVNQMLVELRRDGVVEIADDRHMVIADAAALRRLAAGC